MSRFRVRNLMVGSCVHQATKCAALTGFECALSDQGCGINYSTCFAGSRTWVIDLERLVINPADIRLVQRQLSDALGNIEEAAAELAENLRPRTMAQAEALESALTGALAEVKARKAQLR